jgi:hypothetical protein
MVPLRKVKMAMEKVMIPRPPNWMSRSMTACPAGVKSFAVSSTTSPVTHTAEVDVNSASTKLIPRYVQNGSERRTAPERMSRTKLRSILLMGEIDVKKPLLFMAVE